MCIGNTVFFFVFSPALAMRRHHPKHKLCDLLSAYSAPDFNDENMYSLGLLLHMQKLLSTLWILYFRIPDNTLCLLNPGGPLLPLFPIPVTGGYWPHPVRATRTPVQDDYPRYHFGSSFQEGSFPGPLTPTPKCSLATNISHLLSVWYNFLELQCETIHRSEEFINFALTTVFRLNIPKSTWNQ